MEKATVTFHRRMTDEDFVKYTGQEVVQVERNGDYYKKMVEQYDLLKQKLEAEGWYVRLSYNAHDFGMYVDIKECSKEVQVKLEDIEAYEDEGDYSADFVGSYEDYWMTRDGVDYEEIDRWTAEDVYNIKLVTA